MACQEVTPSGAAPASVAAADMSACLPESVGQGSLVTEDLREVGALSGGVMVPGGTPLSDPLPAGICLFPHPVPAVSWARLAVRCPRRPRAVWGGYGFPTFHRC